MIIIHDYISRQFIQQTVVENLPRTAQSVLKNPQHSRLCSLAQTLSGAPFPQEPSASPTGDDEHR